MGQMEIVAWKHIHAICKIDSRWKFAGSETQTLGLYHNLEGWESGGGGREVQEVGGICTPVANS